MTTNRRRALRHLVDIRRRPCVKCRARIIPPGRGTSKYPQPPGTGKSHFLRRCCLRCGNPAVRRPIRPFRVIVLNSTAHQSRDCVGAGGRPGGWSGQPTRVVENERPPSTVHAETYAAATTLSRPGSATSATSTSARMKEQWRVSWAEPPLRPGPAIPAPHPWRAHQCVAAVAFGGDGRTLASGSYERYRAALRRSPAPPGPPHRASHRPAQKRRPGVCVPWEEKRAELPPFQVDEALARRTWERVDSLGYSFCWVSLTW